MLKEYEINSETLLLLPVDNLVKVYEMEDKEVVNNNIFKVIDWSCRYFGSSFYGRVLGSKELIGSIIKVPIIIEESMNIIFFPTSSIKNKKSIWISFNNLLRVDKLEGNKTRLTFKNDFIIDINVSYRIIHNQLVRCLNLLKCLENRQEKLKKRIKSGEN